MQIKTGKCSITTGTTLVTSNVDSDWSQVKIGCLFVVLGRSQIYFVNSDAVFDATLNSSAGGWKFNINVNYQQATVSVGDYAVVRDFSFNYSIPLLSSGDVETASLFTRAMQILDQKLKETADAGGGGPGSPTTYTKVGHNFVVGSLVYVDSSDVFQLASSADDVKSKFVGMVSSVSGDDFTLQTDGQITGIIQTLSAGSVYYLKNVQTPQNLTSNTTTDITLKIPILVATSTNSGIFFGGASAGALTMTGATSSVPGIGGSTPTPAAGTQAKFLRGDATWATAVPDTAALLFKHLAQTPAFLTSDWAAIDPTDSIYNALLNLHTRITAFEGVTFSYFQDFNPTIIKFDSTKTTAHASTDTETEIQTDFAWTCPLGVSQIKVTAIGGGAGGGLSSSNHASSGGGAGEYIEALLAVTGGVTYIVSIGKGGYYLGTAQTTLNGGNTTFGTSSFLVVAKGGSRGKNTSENPDSAGGAGGTGGTVVGTTIKQLAGQNGLVRQGTSFPGAGGGCMRGGAGGAHSTFESTTNWQDPRDGHWPGGGGSGVNNLGSSGLPGGEGAWGYLKVEWN